MFISKLGWTRLVERWRERRAETLQYDTILTACPVLKIGTSNSKNLVISVSFPASHFLPLPPNLRISVDLCRTVACHWIKESGAHPWRCAPHLLRSQLLIYLLWNCRFYHLLNLLEARARCNLVLLTFGFASQGPWWLHSPHIRPFFKSLLIKRPVTLEKNCSFVRISCRVVKLVRF